MKIGAFDVRGAERGNTVSNWPFAFSFRHACQESFPPSARSQTANQAEGGGEERKEEKTESKFRIRLFSRACVWGGDPRGRGEIVCCVAYCRSPLSDR